MGNIVKGIFLSNLHLVIPRISLSCKLNPIPRMRKRSIGVLLLFFCQVAEMYRSQETVKNNTNPPADTDAIDDFY